MSPQAYLKAHETRATGLTTGKVSVTQAMLDAWYRGNNIPFVWNVPSGLFLTSTQLRAGTAVEFQTSFQRGRFRPSANAAWCATGNGDGAYRSYVPVKTKSSDDKTYTYALD